MIGINPVYVEPEIALRWTVWCGFRQSNLARGQKVQVSYNQENENFRMFLDVSGTTCLFEDSHSAGDSDGVWIQIFCLGQFAVLLPDNAFNKVQKVYRWNNSCLLANPSTRKFNLAHICILTFETNYKQIPSMGLSPKSTPSSHGLSFTNAYLFNFRYPSGTRTHIHSQKRHLEAHCYVTLEIRRRDRKFHTMSMEISGLNLQPSSECFSKFEA